MMKFSIVIPVYNEELNIDSLINEIFLSLKNYENLFELILVNDASTDNSFSKIKNLQLLHPKIIKFVNNSNNLGQSHSLKNGIKVASSKTIVTIDGDGQNNPKDILKLLEKYFSDNSILLVGGIRTKRKDSSIKKISSKIANKVRSNILKDNCTDTGCSLKVFDKDIFMKFPFFNGIHRFLPALFKGYGKNTFFIPVDHRHRIHGKSKYGTFGRLYNGIKDLIKVLKIIKVFKRDHA